MTLQELLQFKHPIFLAPMAGVTTPQLAAEVCNAGGLGALGLGASTPAQALQQILATQALTDAPFQVNFFCHQSTELDAAQGQAWLDYMAPFFSRYHVTPPTALSCIYPSFLDNDDYLKVVLETRPKAVSFHFGLPHPQQIQALKAAGIVTMVSATNLIEAKAIEAAGIDVIIAQGIEAGGHRGVFNQAVDSAITTKDLVQLFKAHCHLPIVAAGGIMNGQHAAKMLNLGANAVQMGTAFIQCKSSNASSAYREALFQQPITQITSSISGRPARGLVNHWHTQVDQPERPTVPPYPYTYDLAKQLHQTASAQDEHHFAAFWAGTRVAHIRALEAADLINLVMLEMKMPS